MARPTPRCRCPFDDPRPRVLIVADEDVLPSSSRRRPMPFLWMVDITDEKQPVPFGSFQVEGSTARRSPR